ncbi:HpcH/HpaI aldolase family protein [Membranihabitans marinus]|uniref:HpcH/HpaI aldolase family protein n=1 Tax=Membranihabitans marinus TaxID=1227546 RepID=UPI001F02A052|nr:aldolase/citrate lyase family protein [Membranihabitans marinus]
MNGSQLKERLKSGERVYGSLITADTPFWVKAVQSIGLDFVFIDTEHLPLNRKEVSWMCHLYDSVGIAPIVRIPSPDPYEASMMIDGNATGIIAPYIETAEQVIQLVGAVKNKPLKGDRLQNLLKNEGRIEDELSGYLTKQNQDRILIVNIESRPAMDALDEILAVDGLDAVLIGPHDLSCSLGIPEQYDHPRFIEAVDEIITKARKQNVGAGIHMIYSGGLEQEIKWANKGGNLILHSADIIAFSNGLKREIDQIKKALGDDHVKGDSPGINI